MDFKTPENTKTMKAYKLTDEDNQTRNNTQWGENVTHEAMGNGKKLCTDGWIHFYEDPLVAMMMNPIHASFNNPHLWEAEAEGEVLREATKSGCKKLTTLKQIPLPEITLTQRVAFGILCALEVCAEESFREWAKNWLSGKDRSVCAAYAAHTAAYFMLLLRMLLMLLILLLMLLMLLLSMLLSILSMMLILLMMLLVLLLLLTIVTLIFQQSSRKQ